MEVIDALAGNASLLKQYQKEYSEFKENERKLSVLKLQKLDETKELDYNSFLLNELQQAGLEGLDQQELEETYETLDNAETIQDAFAQATKFLNEDPIGTIDSAKEARIILGKIKSFSTTYDAFWQRLNSIILELEDLSEEMQNTAENIAADPEMLLQVNDKLQSLYKLQQKHSLSTVQELLDLQNSLEEKVNTTLGLDDKIAEFEIKGKKLSETVLNSGSKIHEKRKKAIPELKSQLESILSILGLPNAQFLFNLDPSEDFKKNGTDTLELLFSANKGMSPGPLKKVASGGEMSRIMLAIKSVLAKYKKLPTIVFDEIDTGVSGEIANKMASIMFQMSKNMQVLTITHLPQIAAKGEHHLKVYKEDIEGVTVTHLKHLDEEGRITEIAQMLGGKKISDAAIANAKELLN